MADIDNMTSDGSSSAKCLAAVLIGSAVAGVVAIVGLATGTSLLKAAFTAWAAGNVAVFVAATHGRSTPPT